MANLQTALQMLKFRCYEAKEDPARLDDIIYAVQLLQQSTPTLHESRKGASTMVKCQACGHEMESQIDDAVQEDLREKLDDARSQQSPDAWSALAAAVEALLDGDEATKRVDQRTDDLDADARPGREAPRGALEAFRESYDPFRRSRRTKGLSPVAAFEEAYENADVTDW